jgi:hypothetical protein
VSNEKISMNRFKSKKNILLFSLIVFILVMAYFSFVSANSFVIEEGSVQNIEKVIKKKILGDYSVKVKDNSIVTIDSKGNIYAKKVGKTSITLGNDERKGNKTKIIKIEVVEPTIALKPNSLNLSLGEERRLVAYNVKNRKAIVKGSWSSENYQKIQVDDSGVTNGLKQGNTYVYYKSENGVTYYTKASVFKPSPFILLTANSEEMKIGDTNIVNVEYSNDHTGLKEGHWSTTDSSIAKIDNDGFVHGKKAGEILVSFKVKDQEPGFVRIKVIDPKEKEIDISALAKQNGHSKKNGSIIKTNFNKNDTNKKVGDDFDYVIDRSSTGLSNFDTLDGSNIIGTKPESIELTLNKFETRVLSKEFDIPLTDVQITQSNPNVAYFSISSKRDSDNTKVIRIKGYSPGENLVTIQYSKNRIKYVYTITIKVTSNEYVPITILPPSSSLKNGSSGTISVTGNAEAIANGRWRSSNTNVAFVDENGTLKILGNSGEKCFIIFDSDRTGESVKYLLTVI